MADIDKLNLNLTPPAPGASPTPSTDKPEDLEAAAAKLAVQLGRGYDGMIDDDCIEHKSITIVAVPRRSAYRAMNDRVLEPKIEKIGSSINAEHALMHDPYLLVKYFPSLVGESYNSPDFQKVVKRWLENISVPIASGTKGTTFNISFRYDTPELKKEYVEKRERLDKAYEKADKSKIQLRKAALNTYLHELMTIEYAKAKHGIPMNIEHYVIYLHAVNYPDVAKDPAFISMSSTVRMFFKDEVKEKAQRDAKQAAKKKAMANYLEATNDKAIFEEMLILCCRHIEVSYRTVTAKGDIEADIFLSKFAMDNPEDFNFLFNDNHRKSKALIEKGIDSGFLFRSNVNQKITTSDNRHIGNNMNEAVAYISDPANITVKKQLMQRLKLD